MISIKKIFIRLSQFSFLFQFIPLKKDEGFNFPYCSKIEENNLFSSLSFCFVLFCLFVCLVVFVFTTNIKTLAINFNFDCLVSFHFILILLLLPKVRQLGLQRSKVKTLLLQRCAALRTFHVTVGQNTRDQITNDRTSKRA